MLFRSNVDLLLDAVALLHAAGRPVTCRVIGDGPQRELLHKRASDLGIEHLVEFRHDVWERKDVYSLVKAARVAVFPSAREGFGIAVLEAMACGVPVVTTSAPDNLARHLVARSAAGVVCGPSAPEIAEAVRGLVENPRAEQDGQEAWIAEYGWDHAADQVARVLGLDTGGALHVR